MNSDGFAIDWNLSYDQLVGKLEFHVENGHGVARFLPRKGKCVLKQADIHLVPGRKYRISAEIRTSAFRMNGGGMIVYNWAWKDSRGISSFPRDTNGAWRRVESIVEAPPGKYELYSLAIYTTGETEGLLEVRCPSLEPVDADGESAKPGPALSKFAWITPLSPLLTKVPAGDSKLELAYLQPIESTQDVTCVIATRAEGDAKKNAQGVYPLHNGRIHARLTGMKPGRGVLYAAICGGQTVIARRTFPIVVDQEVLAPAKTGRRLNTMVTRLLETEAQDGECRFSVEHDGWIWIFLEKGGAQTQACLDGCSEPVVVSRKGERLETLRWIRRGSHVLTLSNTEGGRLIVNAVPQLFFNSYPSKFLAKQQPKYAPFSGAFLRKHLIPVATTLNYGWKMETIPESERREMIERGREFVGQAMHWNARSPGYENRLETSEELAARLRLHGSMTDPFVNGFAFDEIEMAAVKDKLEYAGAMRLLQDAVRPIYTWSSGVAFPFTALDAEYLSAVVNCANGRGRFMFECYPYLSCAQEDDEVAMLGKELNETARRAKRLVPDVLRSALVIAGCYTTVGGGSCYMDELDPDPKRMFDIYFHKLATDLDFEGLAGCGIYAFGNSDEEDVRWIAHLLRHYCLEGKTDMPSDREGFTYLPGHVVNPDFRNGLAGWTISDANGIRVKQVAGFAAKVETRRNAKKTGDDVCSFVRGVQGPNVLSQRLSGLVPGRAYVIRYLVSSAADAFAKDAKLRRYPIECKVFDAEIVTDSTPTAMYGDAERFVRGANLRTVVFRPIKEEAELAFSDETAEIGEELYLDAVRVRPYFWN